MTKEAQQTQMSEALQIEDGHLFEVRTPSDELLIFQAFPSEQEGIYNLMPVYGVTHNRLVPEDVLLQGGMISRRLRVIGINSPEEQSS